MQHTYEAPVCTVHHQRLYSRQQYWKAQRSSDSPSVMAEPSAPEVRFTPILLVLAFLTFFLVFVFIFSHRPLNRSTPLVDGLQVCWKTGHRRVESLEAVFVSDGERRSRNGMLSRASKGIWTKDAVDEW